MSHAALSERLPEVLIVEDNVDHARTLHYVLKLPNGQAYNVTVCFTFCDAVARLKKGGVDAVLLDLGLPDAQGTIYETIQILKAVAPIVPILVITGMEKSEIEATAKQAGASEVFQKGQYSPEQIKHVMEKVRIYRDTQHPTLRIEEKLASFGAKLFSIVEDIEKKVRDSNERMAAITQKQIDEARAQREKAAKERKGDHP